MINLVPEDYREENENKGISYMLHLCYQHIGMMMMKLTLTTDYR